jgi:hypothetical protein
VASELPYPLDFAILGAGPAGLISVAFGQAAVAAIRSHNSLDEE